MAHNKEGELLDMFRLKGRVPTPAKEAVSVQDTEEEHCSAYGYMRGLRERATMIEFRLKNGDFEALSYNLLQGVRFNPSAGLLLRFGGDVTTLVLVAGSNLDVIPMDRTVNLTDRGLLRQRITWIREMDEDELRKAPKGQPAIDELRIVECESEDAVRKWIASNGKVFARKWIGDCDAGGRLR